MECIRCHSTNIVRNGFYKTYQKYKCKNCHRQFSERSFSFFCRHRFPEEVIRNAILFTIFVSTRNASFMLKEILCFLVSHKTIYEWTVKFACLMSKRRTLISVSNIWHADEKFVRVKGCKDFAYFWVVMDDKNSIIAVHVSAKRSIAGAKTVLKLALQQAGKPPDILVTDGLPAYLRACKAVLGRRVRHTVAHFEAAKFMHNKRYYMLSNNRIESLNSKINLWYKKFRGFKSLATANLWCTMWMHFYNFMRPRTIPHEITSINKILR